MKIKGSKHLTPTKLLEKRPWCKCKKNLCFF